MPVPSGRLMKERCEMVQARKRRSQREPLEDDDGLTVTPEWLEAMHRQLDIGLARYYGDPVRHPGEDSASDAEPS